MKRQVNYLWLWLRYGPHVALDWLDAHGAIDHGKAAADLVIAALTTTDCIVSITKGQFIPAGHIITLIAGAMGSRVFIAFLRSRTVTSTEAVLIADAPIQRDIDDPDQTTRDSGVGGIGAAQ